VSRRRDQLNTGAAGRATFAQAAAAGVRHAVAPNLDGCFLQATTDARGRLRLLVSRVKQGDAAGPAEGLALVALEGRLGAGDAKRKVKVMAPGTARAS